MFFSLRFRVKMLVNSVRVHINFLSTFLVLVLLQYMNGSLLYKNSEIVNCFIYE